MLKLGRYCPEILYRATFISYTSTAYVVASYGPRFISTVLKKFGQLATFFWANGLPPPPPPPPPPQKFARTPMKSK